MLQVGGWTSLPLRENVTNPSHVINLLNNLHSSSSPLHHLRKLLHKFRASIYGRAILFAPFHVFPP